MITPPLAMSVVVVNFNTRALLEDCLRSVVAAEPAETVVVDNGSTDGSIELVRESFARCRLIVSTRNDGYGAAANRGIAACSTPGVLLLNSDTVLPPDALTALGRYLAQWPRVGIAGPRLVNGDGSLQRSAYPYPGVLNLLLAESGLHLLIERIPVVRERLYRTWSHDAARRVPWVLGAALAIRRSAFASVGGFDPSYFMYGEEVDLCRRLERAGFETHYAPVTTVVHLGGASTGKCPALMGRELVVSRARYLRRYGPSRSVSRRLAALRAIVIAQLVRDAVLSLAARDRDRRARLRSATDGWRAVLRERELWRP
jgi:N-acetylglucosaminyl-diphospho-decaprenol L-rhamnosyltransferase